MTPLFIALAGIAALMLATIVRQRRRQARERFIDHYAFPRGIRERVRKRYPHLSEDDLDLVLEALREYFHLCRKAGQRLLANFLGWKP